MPPYFQTADDLHADAEILRRRPYGVIEVANGHLSRIQLRPWPKLISLPESVLLGGWSHRHLTGDRCWLYYNQPRQCRNFLVLKYVLSARETRLATFQRALQTLDEIARLKGTDALLCDATNRRISHRLLGRWGWEPHCPSRWHRHYIKRFYGNYPPAAGWVNESVEAGQAEPIPC